MRALTVLAAYLAAGAASSVFAVGMLIFLKVMPRDVVVQMFFMVWLFGSILSGIAALPAISFAESRGIKRARYYVFAGLAAGALTSLILYRELELAFLGIVIASTTLASFIYFQIAWKIFPPQKTAKERQI